MVTKLKRLIEPVSGTMAVPFKPMGVLIVSF